jgi:hypothetical protein
MDRSCRGSSDSIDAGDAGTAWDDEREVGRAGRPVDDVDPSRVSWIP